MDPIELIKRATKEGIIAKKALGQNFLIDDSVIAFILDQFSAEDVILEIGSGFGAITLPLLNKTKVVWTIEKDRSMIRFLQNQAGVVGNDAKKLTIVPGDYLKESAELKKNIPKPYKIFGNIPYYITKPIIQDILFSPFEMQPTEAVLMIQKEVAERLVGDRGSDGVLTVVAQLRAKVELLAIVPNTAFRPRPAVNSALVKFTIGDEHSKAKLLQDNNISEKEFIRLVKSCFANRRKKLRNTLAAFLRSEPSYAEALLKQAGIDPDLRSENLKFEAWVSLATSVQGNPKGVG